MGYDFLKLVPSRICYLLPLERFFTFFTWLQDAKEGARKGMGGNRAFSHQGTWAHRKEQTNKTGNESAQYCFFYFCVI